MTLREIVTELGLTQTKRTRLVRDDKDQWWLVGCLEGDTKLPRTMNQARDPDDALTMIGNWLNG